MKDRRGCPQTWQAEAIDDGRLGGDDRALFERHTLSCAECASEWGELMRLRETMTHLPEASSSPFVRRKLQRELIERVARDGWSKEPRPFRRLVIALAAGVLVVGGLAFGASRWKSTTPPPVIASTPVAVDLQEPERLLRAGNAPTRPPTPTAEPTTSTAIAIPAAPAVRPPVIVSHPNGGSAQAHEAEPVADSFATGVSAFEAGDYRRADESLSRFLAESPSDPRGEDASFLRALAHARWGDKQGAAKLAQKYLSRYPSGLRRHEAERLLRED